MNLKRFHGQSVWIIGAGSGLGRALAAELAKRGARLALSGRRLSALEETAALCGNDARVFPLDVTDADMCRSAAHEVRQAFGRLDRVIHLAAAYAPGRLTTLDPAEASRILNVNLLGAFHVIGAALPILTEQPEGGQLALCASSAGYTGLPGGQPYSAGKAGLINLAESLRAEAPAHVDVKLICPGFIRTDLTAKNTFPMPMILEPEDAARRTAEGICRRAFEIHYPFPFTLALKVLRLLPYALSLKLTRLLNTER